jgi:hypothetical protein
MYMHVCAVYVLLRQFMHIVLFTKNFEGKITNSMFSSNNIIGLISLNKRQDTAAAVFVHVCVRYHVRISVGLWVTWPEI